MTVSITTLWAVNTAEKLFALGLELASAVGLPTTSWRTGDPERSFYKFMAEVLADHDSVVSTWIKAGFLSAAVEDAKESGDSSWLKLLAYDMYGISVPSAGYATPTVTLHNGGGGNYPRLAGEITVKNSATGKTYHNTNAPAPLSAGATVTYALEADESGAASSSAVNEIDEIVTTMLGVVVVSSTAGYTNDELTPDEIGELCRDSTGALSPNGAPDAYAFVCKSSELTGSTEVTRASATGESTTGTVAVYVAGAAGAVGSASVALCQLAVNRWARPLTVTATVYSATPRVIPVTCQVLGANIPAGFEGLVGAEISKYLATVDIAGVVYRSALIAAVHRAVPAAASVIMSVPAADVVLDVQEVPTPGVITATEV
jgi:hypothetical protein